VSFPAQHPAVCGREVYPLAVSSAQASWSARPQAEVSWADRCAVGCRPEARPLEACHARNARAETCRQAVSRLVASSSEQQSEEPAVSDAQAQPLEVAEEAAACASAQQPAEAAVVLAQPVAEAAERAAAVAVVAVPHAAGVAEEAVPHAAGVAEAAEEPALLQAVVVAAAVAEPVLPPAEAAEVARSVLRAAVARPSAAPSAFHPGQVLPWPAPPRAVRFAHAMQCSQIAPLTARWWPAARGEVWSW
jgi:hypothetical protein